jgi:signal transduction histidine kinase
VKRRAHEPPVEGVTEAPSATGHDRRGPFDRARRRLRTRVVFASALGGLILAVAVGSGTYIVTAQFLTNQRVRLATRLAYADAQTVRDAFDDPVVTPQAGLRNVDLSANSEAILVVNNQSYSTGITIDQSQLPAELVAMVNMGNPARQRVELFGLPYVVVGVPISSIDAQYYELSELTELDDSLNALAATIIAASALGTMTSAFLGLWAARRVLRPIAGASSMAARIAAGDLSSRLDEADDPDLEELARSFNTMVRSLNERIEREARFVSDVSHELRTPLTTLANAVQLLENRRASLPDSSQTALDLLSSEIHRFQELVADLLELSSVDAGAQNSEETPVLLGELIFHLVAQGDNSDIAIELDDEVARTPLLLDKRRIERVVTNLVQNARTHAQGATALIASRAGDSLRIEVRDAGPGVPAGDRQRIFERFHRGAVSGRRGDAPTGTGLGLALVAEHVRIMGGRVWVEDSPKPPGSSFVLEVPWNVE